MSSSVEEFADVELAQRRLRWTQFSVDQAADAIFWVAADGRIRYVNEQAVRSLGYTHEELLRLRVPDIDPLYPAETWDQNWQKLRETGFQAVESIHRRADGSEFPVWVHASYYRDEDTELSFACCRDLTEKKSVELALRRANEELELRVLQRTGELAASEARYQGLYHNAPDMFASIDATTGRIVQCNRTLGESTGYSVEELVGREVTELYDPSCLDAVRQAWATLASADEVRDRELRLQCKDGRVIEVSVNMSAIRGPDGQVVQRQCTYRDITDYRCAEQQVERHRSELAHVGRLATTGEMAAGLAHELNQPLYAMNNFAQGAMRRLEAGSLDRDMLMGVLRDISHESQRAAEIIRSLRRYVGKREPKRADIDVNESVRRVVRLLVTEAHRRHAIIETQLSEPLPPVRCDEIQIEQVLMNLILNGLEAMVDSPEGDRRIWIRSQLIDRGTIQLAVSDRGPGLRAAEADRIFDPFYTTKPEGIGLGLAISRTIVEAHGGRLDVTANADRGVTASFALPINSSDL